MTSNLTRGTLFSLHKNVEGTEWVDAGCFRNVFWIVTSWTRHTRASFGGRLLLLEVLQPSRTQKEKSVLFVLLKTRFMIALADHRLGRTLAFPVMQFVAKHSRWRWRRPSTKVSLKIFSLCSWFANANTFQYDSCAVYSLFFCCSCLHTVCNNKKRIAAAVADVYSLILD